MRTPIFRFSVFVVLCVLGLITVGGLVTSWNAGMAVPDWPLSFGSLNPEGWWADFAVRLEHGHRLYAASVGVLVGILVAWLHRDFRSLGVALTAAIVVSVVGRLLGLSAPAKMHLGLWVPAFCFLAYLSWKADAGNRLALVGRFAFVLVCVQATLGGFRVTQETAGSVDVALVLRVFHGCVAQLFLSLLVMISCQLSGFGVPAFSLARGFFGRWILLSALFMQLIFGATIRHRGAGLAIPTFPAAAPDGSWMLKQHGFLLDLHFTHSRLMPLLVLGLVAWILWRDSRIEGRLRAVRVLPLALVVFQIVLGLSVIWSGRSAGVTTLHVLTGASLLASVVLNLCVDASGGFRTVNGERGGE